MEPTHILVPIREYYKNVSFYKRPVFIGRDCPKICLNEEYIQERAYYSSVVFKSEINPFADGYRQAITDLLNIK